MFTNASELVTRSFNLADIVSKDLETVSGSQSAEGLRILNDLLDELSIDGRYVLYYGYMTLPLIEGQEKYNVPGLIDVDPLTFNIGKVRYEMMRVERRQYLGSSRVDDVKSLPFTYYTERVLGGTDIYLYFSPADNYTLNITGKMSLVNVKPFDNLRLQLDGFSISYLTYALAIRLLDAYGLPVPAEIQKRHDIIENQLADIGKKDMTVTRVSSLQSFPMGYWARANLSTGWTP
jgi:hypothetical protein